MSKSRTIAGVGFGTALGVLLGFYVLAPNVEGGPSGDSSNVKRELVTAESDRDAARLDADASDDVLASLAERAVAGQLKGQRVAVISFSDANRDTVNKVTGLVKSAGGEVAGQLNLTPDILTADKGDKLKSLAANSLPAGAQLNEHVLSPGMHTGQVLGAAVTSDLRTAGKSGDEKSTGKKSKTKQSGKPANESDRSVVLGALKKEGVLESKETAADGISGGSEGADLAIILTGPSDQEAGQAGQEDGNYAAQFIADFAAGVRTQMKGAVLAGNDGAAQKDAAIGIVRGKRDYAEEVSTVDNAQRVAGRISVIRAAKEQADGEAGHYGSASNAKAATVD